ncbi:aminotransferase class III-fold pyridoxal phosphate-dependent enzyme [Streptomyces echinatus]|uniref:aminotransferase class III-fold pyridoxal phosphate-dependent enzyme n=1 Tax=Streptomyces echinatus TaxID=67293 RepID=UPI003CD0B350
MNCLDANSISTFGGTQITMAAGLANLGYLLEHDLQGNARRVGGLLIERLRAVTAQLPGVREVRGRGLMIGVELVKPGTDEADPRTAAPPCWRRHARAGCSSAREEGTTPAPCGSPRRCP